MRKIFLASVIALAIALPAAAAPLWLERQFIPSPQLIDPGFSKDNPGSTATVDHSAWGAFLKAHVKAGEDGVNRIGYGAVGAGERAALEDYIKSLEATDVAALSRDAQLAFWINLYNAATVRLVLDNYPLQSIRDLDDPWDTEVVTVSGRALTLNDIEHGVVRPVFSEPRAHYALNCASMGCPNLAAQPYSGAGLDAQLSAAARAYVNSPRGVSVEGQRVTVSKIYGWYREDFGRDEAQVLDHIRRYADPALAKALAGKTGIDKYVYDWLLNDAAP